MSQRRRVLAISSAGGHWIQLRRIAPAFTDVAEVHWATTAPDYRDEVPATDGFTVVREATRWDKPGLLVLAWQVTKLLLRVRPDVVISTGAAPGWFALRIGKALGARTVWLDSIANVEELSMSGRRVRDCADLWLTQWPELADEDEGPFHRGAVL